MSCRSLGANKTVIYSSLAAKTTGQCSGTLRLDKHTAISQSSRTGHFRRDGIPTTRICSRQLPSMANSRYRRYRTPILLLLLQTRLRPMAKTSSRKLRRRPRHRPSHCPGLQSGSRDRSRSLSASVGVSSLSDLPSLANRENPRLRSPNLK